MNRLYLLLCVFPIVTWGAEVTIVLDPPLDQGTVFCEVYRTADDFENFKSPFRVEMYSLADGEPLVVRDLPAGEVVVVVFLDENENGRLDRNFLSIPREPIAFSNGYRPRGPPVFFRARIQLAEGEARDVPLELRRTLGKRGRLGLGMGIIARSSPYVGDGEAALQVIPAATYVGDRLQILGPAAQFGIFGGPNLNLAVKAQYRIGAYDEGDSPELNGLGDREDTLMGGLALKIEAPYGVGVQARYLHDVLDRIGGGSAELAIDRTLPIRRVRITPHIGVQWLSPDIANHDFGVPGSAATADRRAYDTGSILQPVVGLSGSLEVTEALVVFLQAGMELLDDAITDSPIVEDDRVFTGFAAITYLF